MTQFLKEAIFFLFWAVAFGVAYTQAPLYYSNQNQYFLHGLANAGRGELDRDWLANTRDPTPVFSAAVTVTYRYFDETFFYAYYVLLQGLYFWSLVGIGCRLTGLKPASVAGLCFMTLLLIVHAGLTRLVSTRITGIDYPWFLQCGVAGQYILGFGLQPSVFGVFLVTSIYAFLKDRSFQAASWAAAAGIMHSTYLLGAAMLILAYMVVLMRVGSSRRALAMGLLALGLVTPVLVYNYVSFAPTDREDFARSQHILAHFRIPHHAVVERWLDGIAIIQTGWMILAIVLVWRTPPFMILGSTFVFSLLLTLLQVITGNDSLALLFPWRTSAMLVPVATAIIIVRLMARLQPWLVRRAVRQARVIQAACFVSIICVTTGGAAIMRFGWGYHTNDAELPLLAHVRAHRQSGETYLLPVSVPKSGTGAHGAFSTNFTPAPRPGTHLIAIDLQRFRLDTGVPIYVDFKSIPYQDVEVLEWKSRVDWNAQLYARGDWQRADTLAQLRQRGITHIVTTRARGIPVSGAEQVYVDECYALYRLQPVPTEK